MASRFSLSPKDPRPGTVVIVCPTCTGTRLIVQPSVNLLSLVFRTCRTCAGNGTLELTYDAATGSGVNKGPRRVAD